jgi:hypothetical protein
VPAVSAPSAELRKDAVSVEMLESLGLGSAQVNLLNAIASELSKIPGVIAVVLGGSYARRAARPDSDLDVGLYYSKNSPPDIEAIRRCAETISVPNSPPQSLWTTTSGDFGSTAARGFKERWESWTFCTVTLNRSSA